MVINHGLLSRNALRYKRKVKKHEAKLNVSIIFFSGSKYHKLKGTREDQCLLFLEHGFLQHDLLSFRPQH